MARHYLNRRTFLRGVGGAAVGLPLLGAMGCGRSEPPQLRTAGLAAGELPRRFIVFFSANGTIPHNWRPSGGELDFELSPILAPLEAHKSDLVIIDGVDMRSARNGPGDGHQRGMGHALTGTELLEGPFEANGVSAGYAGGISVDQAIANHIGDDTRFRSVELGVLVDRTDVWGRMCYSDADRPLPPEDNPYAAFDRIFGAVDSDPAGTTARNARRQQILAAVMDDYRSVSARLGRDARHRLEAHVDLVDDLAARLDNGTGVGEACERPALGPPIDHKKNDNVPVVGRLQMDLMAMALACDLTRVASLQWSRSFNGLRHRWIGVVRGHHDLSHKGDSDSAAVEALTKINTWYASQLSYLVDRLKALPEGDGTVFDNTVILWSNELGKGNTHTRDNVPFVLACGANVGLETGRYLRYDNDPHNNLLVSLLNLMGVDTTSFGNPEYCTGPLANLV